MQCAFNPPPEVDWVDWVKAVVIRIRAIRIGCGHTQFSLNLSAREFMPGQGHEFTCTAATEMCAISGALSGALSSAQPGATG